MKNKNTQDIIPTKHSIKTDYRLSLQNALQTSLHRLNNKDCLKERQSIQTVYTTKHSTNPGRRSIASIVSSVVKNSNVHYVKAKKERKIDDYAYKQKRVFSKITKAWSTDSVKEFHRKFYKAPDFEQRSAINELHKRYFE